jgi:hypothetical protein
VGIVPSTPPQEILNVQFLVNPTGTAIDYSLYGGPAIGTGTGMAINPRRASSS